MDIKTVIEIIRNLTAKTVERGCSEAEAMAAASKVGELLKLYNLSMDKVFLGESKCVTFVLDTGRKSRHSIDLCMTAIANFCDCKVWFSVGRNFVQQNGKWIKQKENACYNFFGMETDTLMANYLYNMIFNAIEKESENFKESETYLWAESNRKGLTVSFQRGMANRISTRLEEMKSKRQAEETPVPTPGSSGTSLVLVKRNKIDEEFKELELRLSKGTRNLSETNVDAYSEGIEAANKVNLSRPLGGKHKITGLLEN